MADTASDASWSCLTQSLLLETAKFLPQNAVLQSRLVCTHWRTSLVPALHHAYCDSTAVPNAWESELARLAAALPDVTHLRASFTPAPATGIDLTPLGLLPRLSDLTLADLDTCSSDISKISLPALPAAAPLLRTLTVHSIDPPTPATLAALRLLPALRTLVLHASGVSDVHLAAIAQMASLRHLEFHPARSLTPAGWQALTGLHRLTHLSGRWPSLRAATHLPAGPLPAFAPLAAITTLRHLALPIAPPTTAHDAAAWAAALPPFMHLTTLHLQVTSLLPEHLAPLLSTPSRPPLTLHALLKPTLADPPLTNPFAPPAPPAPPLTLHLSTTMHPHLLSARTLLYLRPHLPTTHLTLESLALTCASIAHIATLTSLTQLTLTRCSLATTPSDLIALTALSRLQSFTLATTEISANSVPLIPPLIMLNIANRWAATLRHLSIQGSLRLDPQGLAQLNRLTRLTSLTASCLIPLPTLPPKFSKAPTCPSSPASPRSNPHIIHPTLNPLSFHHLQHLVSLHLDFSYPPSSPQAAFPPAHPPVPSHICHAPPSAACPAPAATTAAVPTTPPLLPPTLQTLHLTGSSPFLPPCLALLHPLPALTALHLLHTCPAAATLPAAIRAAPMLHTLALETPATLPPATLARLAACAFLRSLDLEVGGLGAAHLAALTGLTGLRQLAVKGPLLEGPVLEAGALQQLTALTGLRQLMLVGVESRQAAGDLTRLLPYLAHAETLFAGERGSIV